MAPRNASAACLCEEWCTTAPSVNPADARRTIIRMKARRRRKDTSDFRGRTGTRRSLPFIQVCIAKRFEGPKHPSCEGRCLFFSILTVHRIHWRGDCRLRLLALQARYYLRRRSKFQDLTNKKFARTNFGGLCAFSASPGLPLYSPGSTSTVDLFNVP